MLIVNHDGRGWWDPQNDTAKGDVISLVQHLDRNLNFGQVRKVLRPFVGLSPTYPEIMRSREAREDDRTIADRWSSKARLSRGCPAWAYLATPQVLEAARAADAVREGAYGSDWFAHRDETGTCSRTESKAICRRRSTSA